MRANWGKLALVLSVAALILAGCTRESARKVSLSKTQDTAQTSSERWTCLGCKTAPSSAQDWRGEVPTHYVAAGVMRIAVSAMTMPREALGLYQELLTYVGHKLGRRVELVQRKTYHEVNDLVEARLVDVAFVCSLPYVLGHSKFGLELLAAPEIDGSPVYYSYIIVRQDSGISNMEQLRGKTFAFTDPDSNTGTLYPTYRLAQMGESPGSFFRNNVYTYGHDSSIKAVLEKTVDGAAVDSLVFNNVASRDPVVASQVKVIESSPPFASPPIVVHPALAPAQKEQLRGILMNMDKDTEGREILRKMKIDRFVLPNDSAYDSIRDMYRKVQSINLESSR